MMERVYYSLVKKGLKQLDDVPASIREKVAAMLAADENA